MASTKFEVRGTENNHLVIDDNYRNLCLVKSGVAYGGQNSERLDMYAVEYEANQNDLTPVAAFSCHKSSILVYGLIRKNNKYKWIIRTIGGRNPVLEYYIFAEPKELPSSKYGLQSFNAQGKLVFDSNLQYTKLVDFVIIKNGETPVATREYIPGRKYAAISLSVMWLIDYNAILFPQKTQVVISRLVPRFDGHKLTVSPAAVSFSSIPKEENFNQPFWGSSYGDTVLMILDVTDY